MLKYYFIWISIYLLFSSNSIAQNHTKTDSFVGIGISVDYAKEVGYAYIVEVVSGSPAAMAGLRSGYFITNIGTWSTRHKTSEQVAKKLRGKSGTFVELTIQTGSEALYSATLKLTVERKRIIVENQPANLCDALDRMMKAGVDTFSKIKGKMPNESIENKQRSSLEWESSLKLPKFSKTSIMKSGNNDAYFKAIYFQGKDSIQAIHLFDRLVSDVHDCMAYTCAESFQETNTAVITGFSTTFVISQVKSNNPASIKGSVITVIYHHQNGMPQEVRLEYNLKK